MSEWKPALSASRAKEYERCPLQYRLHVVDRIPEPPTRATTMGTLIHSVLEHLFDVAPAERTPEHADSLATTTWEQMREKDPSLLTLFDSPQDQESWMDQVRKILKNYFSIEDPQWLQPAAREQLIDAVTDEGVRIRGFIDRIDCAPDGALRVVDYKTGKAPSPRFQEEALFQMRFYALLLQLTRRLPKRLQLVYLKAGQILTLDPTPEAIASFRLQLFDLWTRIERDAQRAHFDPRRNPLCNWCGVQSMCPLFGGTTPPIPEERIEWLLQTRVHT
ncbi:PD-(D/E)XK nuclease family protein [Schaalia sp. ZJ405]|uniref:RecB family exonuclease n=1 Tax=Schaalia sp. ZJ405 TaxID=2709403 RepID=UPI0013EB49B4|nr:PD-(D/E)XK nuclease family protein [Schaalia sp. ZJ405]QPK82069.1 PD-(D/E)XK nuclease family protein [Schaalia sp. ZJ405]